jgi:hypothetical protein
MPLPQFSGMLYSETQRWKFEAEKSELQMKRTPESRGLKL